MSEQKISNDCNSTTIASNGKPIDDIIDDIIDLSSDEEENGLRQSVDDKRLIIEDIISEYIENNGLKKLNEKMEYIDSFVGLICQLNEEKHNFLELKEIQDLLINTKNSMNQTEAVEQIHLYHNQMMRTLRSKLTKESDSSSGMRQTYTSEECVVDSVSLTSDAMNAINDTSNESCSSSKLNSSEDIEKNERELRFWESERIRISNIIKHLGKKTYDLNALNDTNDYALRRDLEIQFIGIHNKICGLSHISKDVGLEMDKQFHFDFIADIDLRQSLESEMNQLMKRREILDKQDIIKLVKKSNTEKGLALNNIDNYCDNIFIQLHKEIKRRRKVDTEHFLHFISNENIEHNSGPEFGPEFHPKDKELEEKLQKNKEIAKNKLKKLFQKFENKEENDLQELQLYEDRYEKTLATLNQQMFRNLNDTSAQKRSCESSAQTSKLLKSNVNHNSSEMYCEDSAQELPLSQDIIIVD